MKPETIKRDGKWEIDRYEDGAASVGGSLYTNNGLTFAGAARRVSRKAKALMLTVVKR